MAFGLNSDFSCNFSYNFYLGLFFALLIFMVLSIDFWLFNNLFILNFWFSIQRFCF